MYDYANDNAIPEESRKNMDLPKIENAWKEYERVTGNTRESDITVFTHDSAYYVNAMEKQLKDNGDKLSAEDKATVENEIAAFKKVREGNNASEIKNAMEGLTQKVYAIFGKLYQQQGGQPGPDMGGYQAGPQPGTQNDDGSFNADGSVQ